MLAGQRLLSATGKRDRKNGRYVAGRRCWSASGREPRSAIRDHRVGGKRDGRFTSHRNWRRLSKTANAPTWSRNSAAKCLARFHRPLHATAFSLLANKLQAEDARVAWRRRGPSAAAWLSDRQLAELVLAVASAEALELGAVIGVFAQSDDDEIGMALVDALAKSPGRSVISPPDGMRFLPNFPEEVRGQGSGGAQIDLARCPGSRRSDWTNC